MSNDVENTSNEEVENEEMEAAPVKTQSDKNSGGAPTKLFVGSLSFKTDDAGLEEHFISSGKVLSAKVITDRETGRSRGFGFVEMASKSDAEAAIKQLDGKELDGRTLAISIAQPSVKREGGGGGGGFRRSPGGNGGAGAGRGDSRGGFGAGRGDSRGGFGAGRGGDNRGGDSHGNGGGRGERRSNSW